MRIALITAMTSKGVIGNQNSLPWRIPEELKYFKKVTLGKPIIMGRKTFESMNNKPLPGRQNIILTHSKKFQALGCSVVHSVEDAIQSAGYCEEAMVIGGAKIYEAFLPLASRLYVTRIKKEYEGDTYFPEIDWQNWVMVEEGNQDLFITQIWDKK